jgi:hypothetical protein
VVTQLSIVLLHSSMISYPSGDHLTVLGDNKALVGELFEASNHSIRVNK